MSAEEFPPHATRHQRQFVTLFYTFAAIVLSENGSRPRDESSDAEVTRLWAAVKACGRLGGFG
jgi:hypothetical protein